MHAHQGGRNVVACKISAQCTIPSWALADDQWISVVAIFPTTVAWSLESSKVRSSFSSKNFTRIKTRRNIDKLLCHPKGGW